MIFGCCNNKFYLKECVKKEEKELVKKKEKSVIKLDKQTLCLKKNKRI